MIGGVYNNVSGAIVIELSNMKELKGTILIYNLKETRNLRLLLLQLSWDMVLYLQP